MESEKNTTLEDFRAGRIDGQEVAMRIQARIEKRRRLEETPTEEDTERKKRKTELKATLKSGVRAPIPFPSKVVVGDTKHCLKSYTNGVARFGTNSEVVISTERKDGSVGGVPQIVDFVLSILYNGVHLGRIECRVDQE